MGDEDILIGIKFSGVCHSDILPQTQEVIEYCAENKIYPEIQLIKASEVNDTWDKVINKEARYRYVIDASTF